LVVFPGSGNSIFFNIRSLAHLLSTLFLGGGYRSEPAGEMQKSAGMKISSLPRPSLFALRSAMISIALLLIAFVVIQRVEHRVTVWTLTRDVSPR